MTRYANLLKVDSPNPNIGHLQRPNSFAKLMKVDIKINSDGFRDQEYPIQKKSGKRRIIFLGDSITFGWGVEKESTYEYLIESELNNQNPTEIINLGSGNYNTVQEVNLFIDKGLKYNPDEVVLFYFINDAETVPEKSVLQIVSRSQLFTFFWSRFKLIEHRLGITPNYIFYYKDLYSDGKPGWRDAQNAFLLLKEVCVKNNIALKVITLPDLHELKDYPFIGEHMLLKNFLDEHSILNIDLTNQFVDLENSKLLWVASDDTHPNTLGHKLIAQYSLPFISKN